MARDRSTAGDATAEIENQEVAAVSAAEATENAAAPAEDKADERFKLITRPGTSEQVKRAEYIRELWTGKVTSNNPEGKKFKRGAIAKHLTEITGKKVLYQIVFQATKGIPGGPAEAEESVPGGGGDAATTGGEAA